MTSYILLLTLAVAIAQSNNNFQVQIIDTGEYFYASRTAVNAGPSTGDMLNFHYFPGLKYYQGGLYKNASDELRYVIDRPEYLKANANQALYLSTAHYVRGMIYFYHATGLGRLSLAKDEFESAIKWNSRNYLAHLELSRVFSSSGLKAKS